MASKQMTWNYRVYRYKDGSLGVHETFYNVEEDQKDPIPTEDSIIGGAETIEELLENVEMIKKDILRCKDDILEWEEIEDGK